MELNHCFKIGSGALLDLLASHRRKRCGQGFSSTHQVEPPLQKASGLWIKCGQSDDQEKRNFSGCLGQDRRPVSVLRQKRMDSQ